MVTSIADGVQPRRSYHINTTSNTEINDGIFHLGRRVALLNKQTKWRPRVGDRKKGKTANKKLVCTSANAQ